MATSIRGQGYERVVFSFMRNGLKTVFYEDSDFCTECMNEEIELTFSEERFDELFNEITFGHEC